MNNIKIIFQYNGTNFYGFQKQINKRTVQGEIEKVLNIITKEEINLISAGRTDRYVHAKYQVSNFKTKLNLSNDKWEYILKRSLPQDIKILKIENVDLDFHSRYDAKYREYEYIITNEHNPFTYNLATYVKDKIDTKKLFDILKPLIGIHNFKNFKLTDDKEINTIREIYEIKIEEYEKKIKIIISANSFLKSQIRIIIGTALDIYFNKVKNDLIIEMLNNFDKDFKKRLAEPNGLYLSDIKY